MQKKYLAEMITAGCSASWICAFVLFVPALFPLTLLAAKKSSNVEFNTSFLDSGYTGNVDLQQFNNSNGMLPGQYLVDIYLNDDLITTEKLTFSKQDNGTVTACLSPELIARMNVAPAAIKIADLSEGKCSPLETILPTAKAKFDSGRQALTIALPQQDMQKTARGWVPPSLWQSGSAAAFASYNANTYQAQTQGQAFDSQYLNLRTGLNLGSWYFRHNGSLTRQTGSGSEYQSINSYVQRDISAIRGRFLAGQSNTSGRLFDTVPYTGVSVFSDEQMLPESQRGYAPEIRGIARSSNARVTVRQGGLVIYETTVPAGGFVINDLYPTGYGGDLNVTVRESNGSESTFLVPYASVADLLRPGSYRYEAAAGKYRSQSTHDGQSFYQATWQQGITNILSLYGGTQLSSGYQAWQLGGAVSTPVGAIAIDATQANTKTTNDTLKGQSYRVTWSKLVSDTQSNISLAAYRFSTREYLDFSQAMQYQNLQKGNTVNSALLYRTKNRFSLTLSQGLPEGWGVLSASGITQNYWDRSESTIQYQLGYSNYWKRISYSLTASRNRNLGGSMETSWFFSFSTPLGDERPVMFSAGLARDVAGNLGQQLSLSGTSGEQNQLSWGVSGNRDAQSGTTGSVNGQYISPWTAVTASAAMGKDTRSLSAGMSGAVVAHPYGVTLTPYTSDTWVVVHAPEAAGTEVTSFPGLRLDRWGNAVMPASTPYQRNRVTLDPKNLPDSVELQSTSLSVVPRSGSVVMAQFATQKGYALLLTPAQKMMELPFGTNVTDEKGNYAGMVGQGGLIYARVAAPAGRLFATLSQNGKANTCIIPYGIHSEPVALNKVSYKCN